MVLVLHKPKVFSMLSRSVNNCPDCLIISGVIVIINATFSLVCRFFLHMEVFLTDNQTEKYHNLRQRAEVKLRSSESFQNISPSETLSHVEALRLNEELRVHQIELEIQNEELRGNQIELEASRTRYFDLYDLAPVGYMTLDDNLLIQQANFAAATMIGVERWFLINKPFSQFIFYQDRDIYDQHSKMLIESDELQDWEMRILRADCLSFWVHLQAKPTNNGEYLITFHNITKRKNIQEELELLHKNLETRVVEMVAESRRKDQEMIRQNSLAAMGEMINNIAHQWRNPLNNIALIIQNLEQEYDCGTLTSEEMHREIHKTMDVILQMSETIDDFRNFFRIDKKKCGFLIREAVNRTLSLVSATLKSCCMQVEIKNNDDVTVVGYQNEYSQVLLNIISNSCDACIENSVTDPRIIIQISQENEHSVLYVRDNCGGIPDDVIHKIFDPYFTTRDPDKGTGIGLYMSKMIIEQNMCGHLTASNVDGGAEFRIKV